MAKKRLNRNVVAALGLCGSLAMIILSVMMIQHLQRRDPQHFVKKAREAEEKELWTQAAMFYTKAFERSDDPGYLVLRGEMMLNEGDIGAAVDSWRQALVGQPDLIEAYVKWVSLVVDFSRLDGQINDWLAVQEVAEAFLAVGAPMTGADEALARNAHGLALVHLTPLDERNADKGEAELQAAVQLAPEVTQYVLDLAAQYRRQGRLDEEQGLYEELISRHSEPGAEASKARLAYARHMASSLRGAYQEAEQYFQESIDFAEGEPEVLLDAKLGYAVFLMRQWGRARGEEDEPASATALFEKAEAIMRECSEANPDAFEPFVQLAVLYGSARRRADVVEVCESRLARGFLRKGLEQRRNRLSAFALNILASRACVALGVTTEDPESDEWLTKAEMYVMDARGEFPSHPRVLSQAGRVKLARGQDRAALSDFRSADEAYSSYGVIDWENKTILAQLHLKLSEPGAALSVLEKVIEKARTGGPKDAAFWTLYAQVLFRNNELDRALVASELVLAFDPGNEDAIFLKAAVYERQGKLPQAGAAYGELPGSEAGQALLEASELFSKGATQRGIEVLRAALEEEPDNARLVRAAVIKLMNLGRAEEAREIITQALALKPDDPEFRKLGLLTRQELTPAQRKEEILKIIEEEPDPYKRSLELISFHERENNETMLLPLIETALGHRVARDTPLARKSTIAQHRALLKLKLRVAARLGDNEALKDARDDAAKYNVDGAGGKSFLGLYHDFRDEPELAIKALQEAVELQPTDADSLARLGWCLQAIGRTEDAGIYLERAIAANPNEALAHKGLAAVAQRRGDVEVYEQALEECTNLIPNDPWVRAELLARSEKADPVAAIARREAKLSKHPDDYANLGRLAALCETAGDQAKADRYYLRLWELRGDDQSTVSLISKYYRRSHRPEQSLELVTDFAETRSTPEEKANAHILIAAHHLTQRQYEEVEASLLRAADLAQTLDVTYSLAEFYMLTTGQVAAKALPWLDKAITEARESASPRLVKFLSARIRCLLHRSINDIQAARLSVDEFRREYPDDPTGLFFDSEVHARSGRVDKAIESLDGYLHKRPGDVTAHYTRAQRYVESGRFSRAIEDLEYIKRSDPLAADLRPRLLLAWLHKQADRKGAWIRELESLLDDAPDSATACEALVRAYMDEGRLADAERIITGRINRRSDDPQARWFFLRGGISLKHQEEDQALEDFHRGAEIESYSAESMVLVLDLYVTLERIAEGVSYYEQHSSGENLLAAAVSRYAQLLALSGRKPQAVRQFRLAMNLASRESGQAVLFVAVGLREAFATDEAVRLFEQDAPEAPYARANDRILARLYRRSERIEEADARLTQLIHTAPDDRERADLLHERGEMYQVAHQPDRARRAYEESLKYDDDNWVTLNNLAYLLSDDLGEYGLALPYAKRSARIANRASVEPLDTLGWIYVGLEDYERAIAELSRAIRVDPDMAIAYYHLGEAYRRDGQFREATAILDSGRGLAREAGDTGLSDLLNASLEKTARRDRVR